MGRFGARSCVAVAGILLAISPCAARASVSARDATATQIYLQYAYAASLAEVKAFHTAIAGVDALAHQIQSECPGVLANAPKPAPGATRSATAEQISEEELDAAFGAAVRTESARRHRFARAVDRLRWSSRRLTRLVHANANAEAERAVIPAPNLCADMRAWVGSGYQAVSAGTQRYLHLESIASAKTNEAVLLSDLEPYENPADKRIIRKISNLGKSVLVGLLSKFFVAYAKVVKALA
jgi:hypothetical protein